MWGREPVTVGRIKEVKEKESKQQGFKVRSKSIHTSHRVWGKSSRNASKESHIPGGWFEMRSSEKASSSTSRFRKEP